jgi:putative oxidoreductase
MTTSDLTHTWAPRLLSVLRIVTGLQFLEHGTQKFLSFPLRATAAPELTSLLGVQGCLEIVGGVLIIVGLFTRPVAFILAGDMAVAYFMVHFAKGFFPALNGGDAAILFCFVFLYLAAAGGGVWSIDAKRER